ncbi:hypothetical protein C8Q74DRAFT_189878 [Fomes fomentarius]|nr:hypothetical protein C8Q74DRAFT_189878 [Fomes fomentarius]
MKFATALTFAAVAFAGVQAQSQSSSGAVPTGITQCILGCISQASSANGCSGITDVTCLCTNQQFQQTATSCLESSCSQQEIQAAQQLQQQQCAAGHDQRSFERRNLGRRNLKRCIRRVQRNQQPLLRRLFRRLLPILRSLLGPQQSLLRHQLSDGRCYLRGV